MKQYCRYCTNALDYNGEGTEFLCNADAPCGNNGAGRFYNATKAKRKNKCQFFEFNSLDIFSYGENGYTKEYKPRDKKKSKHKLDQISFDDLEE